MSTVLRIASSLPLIMFVLWHTKWVLDDWEWWVFTAFLVLMLAGTQYWRGDDE